MDNNCISYFWRAAMRSEFLLALLFSFLLGGGDAVAAPVVVQSGNAAGYMYFPASSSGGASGAISVQVSMSAAAQVPEEIMQVEKAGSCRTAAVAGQICEWEDGKKFQYVSQLGERKIFVEYVAATDVSLIRLGCYGVRAGATNESYGFFNTNMYLRAEKVTGGCPHSGKNHPAAASAYCQAKSMYIPSKDELNQVYVNRGAIGGLKVAGEYYWSSTEHPGMSANSWVQRLNDGTQTAGNRANEYLVRCMRSF